MIRLLRLTPLICLALFACGGGESPADLVITGGQVFTGADSNVHEAVAVAGGRFVAIGTSEDLEGFIGPATVVVDAQGGAVVPGFIDGHVHMEYGISFVRGVDLTGVADKSEWLRRIGERSSELPEGAWITGGAWDHTLLDPPVFPTRQELDEVAPDHPVALRDIDGHTLWANTLALELAGVDRTTPDPTGGEILKDVRGEPTGIFLEAGGLVTAHVPDAQGDEGLALLRETFEYGASLGLTGVHNMAGMERVDDYMRLLDQGELDLRIWFGATGALEELDELKVLRDKAALRSAEGSNGPMVEVGYVKLMADGVLSSRTAALLGPYADHPDTEGSMRMSPDALAEGIVRANEAGFPVAVHAIGDRTVRITLDAMEAAGPVQGLLPNRIEHIEVIDPADVGRFRELGVLASMNPHHCITGIDVYNTDRLGPQRAAMSFAWGGLADAGATLVFGSDWVTAPLSPLDQLYAATVREKPTGGPDGGWHPDNAISWFDALRAYTLAPAEASGWDDEVGSIEVGKWADFVLLDGPVALPVDPEIRSRTVRATYLAGRQTFEASDGG
ncbi:MAG: amidohydrolase [Longimicrobiales bacterium]